MPKIGPQQSSGFLDTGPQTLRQRQICAQGLARTLERWDFPTAILLCGARHGLREHRKCEIFPECYQLHWVSLEIENSDCHANLLLPETVSLLPLPIAEALLRVAFLATTMWMVQFAHIQRLKAT